MNLVRSASGDLVALDTIYRSHDPWTIQNSVATIAQRLVSSQRLVSTLYQCCYVFLTASYLVLSPRRIVWLLETHSYNQFLSAWQYNYWMWQNARENPSTRHNKDSKLTTEWVTEIMQLLIFSIRTSPIGIYTSGAAISMLAELAAHLAPSRQRFDETPHLNYSWSQKERSIPWYN